MSANPKIQKLVRLAMLTALSVVLVLYVRFPIFPAAPYLVYDPADVPILIATFLYGPWSGVAVTVAVSLIQGVAMSADGIVGIVMHILATGAFCLVAGYLYRAKRTLGGAVLALVCGTLTMAAAMAGCNLVLTPIYTGMPRAEVAKMLVPVIIPFNLIKAGINSLATFLVYKPAGRLFGMGESKPAQARE